MPLSFAPMPRGAFTGFQMIFLFSLSLLPEAESECRVCQPAPWMKQAPTHSRTNREEWFYPSDRTRSAKHIKSYFLAGGLPGFTPPAVSLFLLAFSLFHGFLFRSFPVQSASTSVYLHFRIFQGAHQVVISVLGAKVIPGLDGKARSSLLFSVKISSPAGSIFPKNLASPNPYLFKHPKRKRPMRQKDALKKMSDKREADKIVWNSTPSALESALKTKKSKTAKIWRQRQISDKWRNTSGWRYAAWWCAPPSGCSASFGASLERL